MSELLNISGLTVELPTTAGWVRPVNDVSLRIAAGEALGLVGESGSGKTMLSLALMGLLPAGARTKGEIFSRPFAWLNPRMPVGEIVAEPLAIHELRLSRAQREAQTAAMLQRVGLGQRPCAAIGTNSPSASGSASASPGRSS